MPVKILEEAERLIHEGHFLSKSDFFREGGRLLIEKYRDKVIG
jgi:Arc/MetJ-type ribon-helix-helix transcriptional regulator